MKKNRTMRIATLMLALTLITCCFVGSTFARYTSTAAGGDSVKVAKWEIGVTDKTTPEATIVDITGTNTIKFDLFNTVMDTNGGAAEADVKAGLIAPGTKGSFTYEVANLSEVNAEYDLTYTMTNTNNVPLQFSLTGNGDWTNDIANLNVTNEAIAMENGKAEVTVYWQWDFEGDDTPLGVLAQNEGTCPVVEVSLTITVDQVD